MENAKDHSSAVIPAKAGIQSFTGTTSPVWVPAFAGMTVKRSEAP